MLKIKRCWNIYHFDSQNSVFFSKTSCNSVWSLLIKRKKRLIQLFFQYYKERNDVNWMDLINIIVQRVIKCGWKRNCSSWFFRFKTKAYCFLIYTTEWWKIILQIYRT